MSYVVSFIELDETHWFPTLQIWNILDSGVLSIGRRCGLPRMFTIWLLLDLVAIDERFLHASSRLCKKLGFGIHLEGEFECEFDP